MQEAMAAAIAAAKKDKSGFVSFGAAVPLGRGQAAAKRKREQERDEDPPSSSDSEDAAANGKKSAKSSAVAAAAPVVPKDPVESVETLTKVMKGSDILGSALVRRFVKAVLHDWKKGKVADSSAPP